MSETKKYCSKHLKEGRNNRAKATVDTDGQA